MADAAAVVVLSRKGGNSVATATVGHGLLGLEIRMIAGVKLEREKATLVQENVGSSRRLTDSGSSLQRPRNSPEWSALRLLNPQLQVSHFHELASDENAKGRIVSGDAETDVEEDARSCKRNTSTPLLSRVKQVRNKAVLKLILDWIAEGHRPQRRDITAVITVLRRQNRFAEALEVSEWLLKEKPFNLGELDYACWIYLVGKVHGLQNAEDLLIQVPSKFRKGMAYESLVEISFDEDNISDTVRLMKKMKDLKIPIKTFSYNILIMLYHRNKRESEIPVLLNDMNKDGVTCNIHTYNILIRMMAKNHDIKGMEEIMETIKSDACVEPDHVTYMTLASAYLEAGFSEKAEAAAKEVEKKNFRGMRRRTVDQLMLVYAYLGKLVDVEWVYHHARKSLPFLPLNTFVSAIEAFGELGCIDRAEQVVEEMVHERGWHHVKQFNAILGAYVRNGLMEKAEEVLRQLQASSHQPNAITLNYLLLGYLKASQMEKALDTMKAARNVVTTKEITETKPWLRTTLAIIDLFADKGDVEHAEVFFQDLETENLCKYPKAYNILLKAYVKARRPVDDFLTRMSMHSVIPNAETYKLLEQLDESGDIYFSGREK
eukprot:c22291_g1_i1 orf=228-2036(+)